MVGGGHIQSEITNDPVVNYMLKVREEHARQQEKDYSHVFRPKSRFDFIRISCIIIGVELSYAAETAFVTPILLQIGIEHRHMTMVWALSPLLGFFLAPLIGSLSDRCKLSIGRRRPIIIILSINILLGLCFVPFGKNLGLLLGDIGYSAVLANETFMANLTDNGSSIVDTFLTNSTNNGSLLINDDTTMYTSSSLENFKFAIILTILGTISLDFGADTIQSPSRAYLLDICVPSDHAKALSIFTTMAGIGGTFGYTLGAIDWKETNFGSFMGGNIQSVFVIVIVIFCICFTITTTSFREIPLKLIEKDGLLRPLTAAAIKKEIAKNNNPDYYIKETTTLEIKLSEQKVKHNIPLSEKYIKHDNSRTENGLFCPELSISGKNNYDSNLRAIEDEDEDQEERISLMQYLKSIVVMPKSMKILTLTNLFTWMSHLCYCLYFTDFVGEAVYGGSPHATATPEMHALYEDGVRFGCWGLSIYALSCATYSMIVERLMTHFGTRNTYMGGLLSYAVGMFILAAWPTKIGVLILSTTSGVVYSTLFTIPYFLVAKYHSCGCFKVKSGENVPLKQNRGLGTDIAIISSMVFIGQLIVSLSIGTFISWLGSTAAVIYAASALSVCASISAFFVLYLE